MCVVCVSKFDSCCVLVSVFVRWGRHIAIPIIFEGLFQAFQRFSSGKLVLKTVESCFLTLNYYGNGSRLNHDSWQEICETSEVKV